MIIGRIRKLASWYPMYFVEVADNGITRPIGDTYSLWGARRKLKQELMSYDQLYPIVEEIKIP